MTCAISTCNCSARALNALPTSMANLADFQRIDLLGVPLLRITTAEFIDSVVGEASGTSTAPPLLLTYINAWCAVLAQRNPEYMRLLHKADGVYADGQAIVSASGWLGNPVPERVNAADFIVDFCRRAASANASLYLVGSADGVAAEAARQWEQKVPGLKILGAESGYFTDGGESALTRITQANPDILLVGLGVPLQEQWVTANLSRLSAKVVWCVGAMFEYHGKARARAPVWMRRAGLEWLFRLMLEPRRLARRYLIGNLEFLYYVACAKKR